jgi:hypothetical protein
LPSSQEGFDEKNDSSGLVLSSSAQDSMPSPPLYDKEARNIFLQIRDELDALEAVKNQLELLKHALTGPLDYLTIVDAHGSDALQRCFPSINVDYYW